MSYDHLEQKLCWQCVTPMVYKQPPEGFKISMQSEYIISLVIYICDISQNLKQKHKHRYGHVDAFIRMLRLPTHSMSDFYKVLVFCVLM